MISDQQSLLIWYDLWECPNSSLRLPVGWKPISRVPGVSICLQPQLPKVPWPSNRVVLLWLRVLRKEDISESALALLRYLLPPWLLASHRWRRQESPQEWQQMRKGFNHRKVALMHYLLLRPIEHCITGLPWNTSGCEIIKTLGCDSKNTFADDVLDTPRMFLNIHLWRFQHVFQGA